jgi:DNA polymerase-3 subunit alpha
MGMNSHTNYALRKNGAQEVDSIHPELSEPLAEILDPTYGLIVYQEQVMAAAQKAAGFTLGKADLLRRAMGKKNKEELDKQYEGFSAGMRENGYSEGAVKALWDTLLPFADYAFNRAHSAAYGVLSYWTAYLKANYPAEYMAALLTSVGDSKDKLGLYLSECRKMSIKVLPPDINESFAAFSAVGDDIRFGLGAVRNVGLNVVEGIRQAREEKGRFTSFHDFLQKVPAQVCSKRVIESLIKSGAFDSLGYTRRALYAIHEEAVDSQASIKKNEASGQVDLFGSLFDDAAATGISVEIPQFDEWPKKDKLAFERDMLGLYVSDHPLSGREAVIAKYSELSINDLVTSESVKDGETAVIAGLVTAVAHKVARASGNPYGAVTIEDFEGEVTVMLMGKTYQEFGKSLETDQLVVVRGRVSSRDDGNTLNAYSIETIDAAAEVSSGPLLITIPETAATRKSLEELDRILKVHAGYQAVQIRLSSEAGDRIFELQPKVKVSPDLMGELKVLFGANIVN